MAIKRSQKIALGVTAALVVIVAASVFVQQRQAGVTAVQDGRVVRQNLVSIVTASGEIPPPQVRQHQRPSLREDC